MNFQKIIFSFLVIPLTVLFQSCSTQEEDQQKTAEAKPPRSLTGLSVTPVLDLNPEYTLALPGELHPYQEVDIFPKVKGFIKKIYADRGSIVKKGQLLATLEAPEITQHYLASQATSLEQWGKWQFSKQNYKRLKMAAARNGSVAAIDLDKAQSQLNSDSAAYTAAKANTQALAEMRSYLQIRAPFASIVTNRNFSEGALVGSESGNGKALFSLAQYNKLRLAVSIPEKHAQSLLPGTEITFSVSSQPGKIFHASLSRQSRLINQEHRAVSAEFDVENSDFRLNGGEFAQVKLILKRPEPTLWVPVTSIIHAQSGVFVQQVLDGKVTRIPVEEGIRRDTLQEVFGALKPGLLLLKKGNEELVNHEKVQI